MNVDADEVLRALDGLRDLPYGRARTEASARIVTHVDTGGLDLVRAYADFRLVEAHAFGGTPHQAYVPFARLLKLWDTRPELFDAYDRHNLFWAFKWMVHGLASYPAVPAERIEATLDDMRRRYAEAGCPTNAIRLQEFLWAEHRGTGPETDEAYRAWVTTPRDEFSNCLACEPGTRADYLLRCGRQEEAIAELEAVIASGETCESEPQDSISQLMLALLDAGRPAGALALHQRGYPNTRRNVNLAIALGRHLHVLALTGNIARGRRVLLDHVDYLVELPSPLDRLWYLLGAETVIRELVAAQGSDERVTLPAGLPGTTGELLTWVTTTADELAAAFDARNGTSRHADDVRAWRARRPLPQPVPIPAAVAMPSAEPATAAVGPSAEPAPASVGPAPLPSAGATSAVPGEVSAVTDPLERARIAAMEAPAGAVRAQALARLAELLSRRRDPAQAGTIHARAAAEWVAEGDETAAGWALAEAGRCADLLDDVGTALSAYRRALAHLVAAGVPAFERGPVARALARAFAADARAGTSVTLMRELLAELDATPDGATQAAVALERAQCEDVLARALATVQEYPAAVEVARRCAPVFARLGAIADAAHAFLLAGTVTADHLGRPAEAVDDLESAVEGFEIARQRRQHAKAVEHYAAALEACGRAADAVEAWDRLNRW